MRPLIQRLPERDFFVFDDDLEHGYECWWGIPSLPKLDYRSQELRERMYGEEGSVVGRWLRPPYDLDGWRIDVANMTGRLGAVDVLPDVARGVRAAAVATRPRRGRRRRARATTCVATCERAAGTGR